MRQRRRFTGAGPSGAVGQRLRKLSEWAVASCFTAAMGCSNELPGKLAAPLTSGLGPVRQMPCPDLLLVTEPVQADGELDYIGVFDASAENKARHLLGDYGDPCKTAEDRDACLAAIAQLIDEPPTCEPGAPRCKPIIITTRGDEVARHASIESLRGVLGSVDTASEAVLFAQLHGLYATCVQGYDSFNSGTLVQANGSGWRLQSRWRACGEGEGDQAIELRSDGTSDGFTRNVATPPRACASTGRRPQGLQLTAAQGIREPVGAFLAQCAQLEAASVPAFHRLARELRRLGAPQLAAAARRSARDEVRHTVLMDRLAARYGSRPLQPHVPEERRSRSAYEIVLENAVEGCVRETFGALLAWQQSTLAIDPLVARTMRGIAADETRHAELSWQVAGWLEPQLTATERKQLAHARSNALKQLEREIASDALRGAHTAARAQLGWPSAAQQHALLQRLATELNVA